MYAETTDTISVRVHKRWTKSICNDWKSEKLFCLADIIARKIWTVRRLDPFRNELIISIFTLLASEWDLKQHTFCVYLKNELNKFL